MARQDTYSHEPITDPDGIRLVQLEPGLAQVQLYIVFFIPNCQGAPCTKRFSYTWESRYLRDTEQKIYLDGKQFRVRANLWSALWHLREYDQKALPEEENAPSRVLWIDVICIDHGDIKERNHQVGVMGEIYSQAEEVAFWLGPQLDHSEIVIPLIESGISVLSDAFRPLVWSALACLLGRPYW
jgi:Heterokaryon incompatibility protein (HET)